ncbi:MAG: efflux RND transporter periplasmic adaptor subunit [Desulfobacteraceae bacterium]|nr:efflux RND transporter periplasmic adaptor subunit [Desulfobacteraceae bacterium]
MKPLNIKYSIYPLLVLMGLIIALAGCSGEDATASAATAPPAPTVTVSQPLKKNITEYANFSGTTEALESVEIRARVEGFLDEIHFKAGALIEKGELLYSIDPDIYQARLTEVRANLEISKAQLKLAKATSKRRQKAYKNKAVSEVAVIEAAAHLASAKAAVSAAEATIKTAELNLSYTRIVAPISGRIGRSLVDTGNLVGAGDRTLLTTIVRDDPIYVYFTVSERELLNYLERGLDFQPSFASDDTQVLLGLSNQTGFAYKGRIDYRANRVDPETGTLQVRAVFPNSGHRLLPGLFARIRVPMGEATEELLVPETALNRDQQGHFLLVADKDNKVQYRPVSTGTLVDGMRVISKGIGDQDRIIINGLQKARPGSPVRPMEKKSAVESGTHAADQSS